MAPRIVALDDERHGRAAPGAQRSSAPHCFSVNFVQTRGASLAAYSCMWRTLFILAAFGCGQTISDDAAERRKPRVDASTSTDDPPPTDPAAAGVVSCYSSGAPTNTCTTPAYCCFNNYTASHDGYCTTTETCSYGTILCDGPEDCTSGQRCCATATRDPDVGTTGYRMACRSGSCGGPPLDHELCHPNTSSCETGACVTAYGNANDLPRSLYVCN